MVNLFRDEGQVYYYIEFFLQKKKCFFFFSFQVVNYHVRSHVSNMRKGVGEQEKKINAKNCNIHICIFNKKHWNIVHHRFVCICICYAHLINNIHIFRFENTHKKIVQQRNNRFVFLTCNIYCMLFLFINSVWHSIWQYLLHILCRLNNKHIVLHFSVLSTYTYYHIYHSI